MPLSDDHTSKLCELLQQHCDLHLTSEEAIDYAMALLSVMRIMQQFTPPSL